MFNLTYQRKIRIKEEPQWNEPRDIYSDVFPIAPNRTELLPERFKKPLMNIRIMPPESTRVGSSHISRLQELSPWESSALNGFALTMVPCLPKRRPFLSLNQVASFLGAWNGQSPATRMPHKTNRHIANKRSLLVIPNTVDGLADMPVQ